jgi:hypothetical protein
MVTVSSFVWYGSVRVYAANGTNANGRPILWKGTGKV